MTRRVADLLCAQVYVIDQHGSVITTSEPGLTGAPWDGLDTTPQQLRIPLRMGSESGEVIVSSYLARCCFRSSAAPRSPSWRALCAAPN